MCIWWRIQCNHRHTCWIFILRSFATVALCFNLIVKDTVVAGGNGRAADIATGFPTIDNLPVNNLQQACDRTRRVFTEMQGEFSDGPVGYNYTQDSHCEWLIKAKNDSQFITLKFRSMGTECSYDYIFVYDGDSFKSPLLGSFSGRTEPQQVVAASGSMLILLYSDTNYVMDGFHAEYFISNCPNNCTNQGKCVGHQCVCKGDWIAKDCSVHACPDSCGVSEGRGICSKEHCRCNEGYSGKACALHIENNVGNEWHYLASAYSGLTPRAAHSAIYIKETDSLYVYGGYDLNNILGSLQIYRFNKSTWEDEWGISLRSRHFPAEIDNTLLKAVLHQNEQEALLWGLKSDASFFRNILLSISNEDFPRRRPRSPKRSANGTDPFEKHHDISEILEELTEEAHILRPSNRYGHAGCRVNIEGGGFVVYGGKLENGSLSNELWLFNASAIQTEKQWSLRATNSTLRPPALTRHTITLADEDYLYVFGGSLKTGEFSSRIFRIKLKPNDSNDQWEEVFPRGGKTLDVRIVAHTTIYHKSSNSLIVYGGIVVNVARFSRLSDRIFAFQLNERHWTEIQYPRTPIRDAHIPRERAFHTATVIGNYMIAFGGYSHTHNKEEICYDNQMYLYHLGCHIWINQDVLGMNPKSRYPKNQGVFAHAATIRNDNTLLIVGGYHGNVNADLLAYTLPPMLQINKEGSVYDPEMSCSKHTGVSECLSDPECGWCSADNTCYGRTIGANCTTNLQAIRCPGICQALGDCHSCLIHGRDNIGSTKSSINAYSVADKLRLNQCQWCVQNARCHHKDDNYGVCGSETEETGWWGSRGTEVLDAKQCSRLDRRPGLTFLKYLSPVNWTVPDEVMIVNATTVDFMIPSSTTLTEQEIHGDVIARLFGFIRPPKKWGKIDEMWYMCASYSKATLAIDRSTNLEDLTIIASINANQTNCTAIKWQSVLNQNRDDQITNNETMAADRLLIDFQANRTLYAPNGALYNNYHHMHSKIGLLHNGTHENSKAFTFQYLEPYSNGGCASYKNCLQCLTDALCGWCDITNECVSRLIDEQISCSRNKSQSYNESSMDWNYLILQPNQCANCSNYITCEECSMAEICEWWTDDARCARLGRASNAVSSPDECPIPCFARQNCSTCLDEQGRCVWCEATQQCFSFSVYTSEYQFGLCREWLDQSLPYSLANEPVQHQPSIIVGETHASYNHRYHSKQQCKTCEMHTNCSSCLQSLSCGWCFDRDNPIDGLCMRGDFNRSASDCDAALHNASKLKITPGETEWAYAQCPDVDECGLGLHDCHKEAKCTNTYGSYNCYCRRGFIGDGRTSCVRTCFEQCNHGYCSGAPDYKCICDLGWTGESCSQSCGCNNHSTCATGVNNCDFCQSWTEGESCERCRPGSFGNATSERGCQACQCNGHGNEELGICDIQTGECFCQDNTEGLKCEMCNKNYYGDPTNGGQCYFQCEGRGMLKQTGVQGIGSHQTHVNHYGLEARECLWIISPHSSTGSVLTDDVIQLEIQNDPTFNVSCNDNGVYIYDGLPDLIGNNQQRQLLSVFCTEDTKHWIVEAHSGYLTVHYKQSAEGQGFNAIYTVRSCAAGSCLPPHICNELGHCVCRVGFIGPMCEIEICPRNCSETLNQGICDRTYGRCLCNKDFGGRDCSVRLRHEKAIVITELFNSQFISDSLDHLRKTLPRFGHSLVGDRRGNLWMFAGYSLQHQALNDIRQFDTRNNSWMQVTVDSTPDAKMPQGRYFHGADIHHSKQNIYIYGGLAGRDNNNYALHDFWKFSLVNQRWQEVEKSNSFNPPPLAGHTLTIAKDNEHDVILVIGGFSPQNGLAHLFYIFNLTTSEWSIVSSKGSPPVGIFGHTAVFHAQSNNIYVFGGYVFYDNERTMISNKLYVFNLDQKVWNELPVFNDLNRPEENLPRARFLHSAITTNNYMIIYGGRTMPQNSSDLLVAYIYKCNQWIRLTEDVEMVGDWPQPSYAQAMSYDPEAESIYVVNGWDGSVTSRVIRLNIPQDLCELWSRGKYLCRHFMGCSYCTIKPRQEHTSHCYSIDRSYICQVNNINSPSKENNGTLIYNNGSPCDPLWISERNCSSFQTCETCTAIWLNHGEKSPACQWCGDSSSNGRCISAVDSRCPVYNMLIRTNDKCPASICNGDCQTCIERGCQWLNQGDNQWTCSNDDIASTEVEIRQKGMCPLRCEAFKNCSTCLAARDVNDGGFTECRWSTQLEQCISPSYQPLWCVGGICGLVLSPEEISYCPEPCSAYTQCSTCLRHAHCGWCSKSNSNGDGVCTEGSLESGPSEFPAASTCDIIYKSQKNLTEIDPKDEFVWNYVKCPAENECINDHHNCDVKSEKCVDMPVGYKCECAKGFKLDIVNGSKTSSKSVSRISGLTVESMTMKKCMPVCSQGCVRGKCIEPNVCLCDFGYVGSNCSIQCQCNGHSDCKGPDQLDICLDCRNNTVGPQCEMCKPLFVGDSRNNGECVSCLDYCHGHTDICVDRMANVTVRNMTRAQLNVHLTRGPTDDAICLNCENQTTGDRCQGCIYGHFRGNEDYKLPCRRCHCQGHGDTCDPVTGEKCNCGNNTESDATCTSTRNSAHQCWMTQCSKCRDSYTGNPIDGHQCYKQITVESKMCFDAKTIDECKKPAPLKGGQTVFFVIQPRFMNVDIRIIVDVTQGELNLYMSPQDDALVVLPSELNGVHEIFLDDKYTWFSDLHSDSMESVNILQRQRPTSFSSTMLGYNTTFTPNRRKFPDITHDCSPLNLNGLFIKDIHAKDLSTYVTLHKCNTLLRVFNLKNRLVLTLPQNVHNLSSTRFFIALKASNGPASYGLVFFRQDQLHIDLFVFFSVFFSCFFLFLAVCVLIWKAKQANDLRRARMRHVVEMLHMAKRPFASIQLYPTHDYSNTPVQTRRRILRTSVTKNLLTSNSDVRPISVEPTSDNVAAVCTVFVRLPGGSKPSTTLALGSTLAIMNSRQFPIYQRIPYIRRRRISAAAAATATPSNNHLSANSSTASANRTRRNAGNSARHFDRQAAILALT